MRSFTCLVSLRSVTLSFSFHSPVYLVAVHLIYAALDLRITGSRINYKWPLTSI